MLDIGPYFRYLLRISLIEGVTGDVPTAERERFPRAGLVTPHSGDFGHRPGRHYDRSARCSLHWRRGGYSRLHPVIPGSAARS
jgi:hypothetical protein